MDVAERSYGISFVKHSVFALVNFQKNLPTDVKIIQTGTTCFEKRVQ